MSDLVSGDFVEVHAFANADETIINWQGANYYQACDEQVMETPEFKSHCVKRKDHPGDIHEDYDGNRKTIDKGRMTVVVTFPITDDDIKGHGDAQGVLKTLKPHFADQPDVKVFGAVHDKADQIIMILEGDG